jgi:hypothetical protein
MDSRVTALEQAVVNLSSDESALHDLENEVELLQNEEKTLSASQDHGADVKAALDDQQAQIDDLKNRVMSAQASAEDAAARAESAADAAQTARSSAGSPGQGTVLSLRDYPEQLGAAAVGGPTEAGVPTLLDPELSLAGLVQLRYDGARGVVGGPESSFTLPRAQLVANGEVYSSRLRFRLLLDAGGSTIGGYALPSGRLTGPQQRVLKDAYLDFSLRPELAFRAGQMLPPQGREALILDRAILFGERAPFVYSLGYSWDQGVLAHGALFDGLLSYGAGVFNGGGPNIAGLYSGQDGGGRAPQAGTPGHIDFLYAGRLVFEPFGPVDLTEGDIDGGPPAVAIGVSGAYDLVANPSVPATSTMPTPNMALEQGEGDVAFHGNGVSVEAEGTVRRVDEGFGLPAHKYYGFYSQAGYFIIPSRFLAGARVAMAEPVMPPPDGVQWELISEGQIAYYRYGTMVRATLSGGWERDHAVAGGPPVNGFRVEAMTQLAF